MKQLAYIVILLIGLMACGEREEYRDALQRAEAVMDENPDSALLILNNLGQHKKEFGKHFRMQYLLHRTNAQNKTNMKFTSDSVAKELVDHFDNHGTTNERMLAHYLLGRAYSDMGEAPKAINSFQNAINVADTTANDFDFYTLGCVYSQMATVYHRQLLLTNEIDARKKASHYAFRAKKTQWAIYSQVMSAGAYILLNKKDSAELILKSALEQYRKHGYIRQAIRYSRPLIHLYTENPQRLAEAKTLMDQYESESDLFDEHHELPPSHRLYYYYKGKYYEGVHKLDSAEYYYRKVYRPGMSYTSLDPMYRGLLSVFSQRHQADSIAKYAQLYCMANDSSIVLKDRDVIAQMTTIYNYSRSQKEAEQEREKAQKTLNLLGFIILIAIILLLVIIVISWLYRKNQREKKERIAKLEESLNSAKRQRSIVQEELRKLKENDYEGIIAEKERQEAELTKTIKRLQAENSTYIHSKNKNSLDDFLDSKIAQLFVKKARDKFERPIPTEAEWDLLLSQFSKDNPATFKSFGESRSLSQLEQRICILLILGISEKTISTMTASQASTVSNAKARANEKLFGKKEAHSLKTNLIHDLRQS